MSLSLLATKTSVCSSLSSKSPLHQTTKRAPTSLRVNRQVSLNNISCEQKQSGSSAEGSNKNHVIDRRNVLLGIGGLYGATTTIGNQAKVAIGAPIQPPDLSKCHLATDSENKQEVNCCPPYSTANIVDFEPPSHLEPVRRRKPAHKLSKEEIEKFKTAIAKMKALDKDDPWNYMQQATIHCTYCNGAFDQLGFPETLLQVHGSWLFLPWHRYYLYFWERILGKLIDDPTFAIPYWNWDNPEGMTIPSFYLDKSSPLYDDKRNHNHYKALMDYDYNIGDPNPSPSQEEEVKLKNLRKLYNIYKEGLGKSSLFMGKPIRAGEQVPEVAGSLENLHNLPHTWTGPDTTPYHDMGNFYTAARDTMFFGHHANCDRLWDTYSTLRGHKAEFNDPDWLDASFIFYDENRQVVRVKVKDCVNVENLGYTYTSERHAWKDIRRRYKEVIKGKKRAAKESELQLTPVSEFGTQPRLLDSPIRALVPRPKTSRTKGEKEDELEILVIDDIEIEHGHHVKFDVYIAKPIEGLVGPDYGEFAGHFARLPHLHFKKQHSGKKSQLELGITNLLDDIDAESSDKLVVTLVPRHGKVSIGGIFIELFESDL